MSLIVLAPGVQATLQAAPRERLRHLGIPSAGPADAVSMAIANRLVGNAPHAVAIEITHGPAAFQFETPLHFALCGAVATATLDGEPVEHDQTLIANRGATLSISPFQSGARLYLAVSGTLAAQIDLGSASTYLPAALGGHYGRALKPGDSLEVSDVFTPPIIRTPINLQNPPTHSFILRAVPGPDAPEEMHTLAQTDFTITHRASRMGLELEGALPDMPSHQNRPSASVLPGAMQITPSGRGFLLGPDAQTTGGYPHLLQVIRADRHLIGQIRPGDRLRFLMRDQAKAEAALAAKQGLLDTWLEGFRL